MKKETNSMTIQFSFSSQYSSGQEILCLYGAQSSITIFTKAHHWNHSQASSLHLTLSHISKILGIASTFYSWRLPINMLTVFLVFLILTTCPLSCHRILCWIVHNNVKNEEVFNAMCCCFGTHMQQYSSSNMAPYTAWMRMEKLHTTFLHCLSSWYHNCNCCHILLIFQSFIVSGEVTWRAAYSRYGPPQWMNSRPVSEKWFMLCYSTWWMISLLTCKNESLQKESIYSIVFKKWTGYVQTLISTVYAIC